MQKTIDLNLIRESVSAISNEVETDYSSVVLKIASLFAEFTLAEINNKLKALTKEDLNEDQKKLLLTESSSCRNISNNEPRYTLKEETRKKVYMGFPDLMGLRAFSEKLEFTQAGTTQKILLDLIKGEGTDITALDLEHLVALHQAVCWLGVIIDPLPDKESINRQIKLREKLAPFYTSTRYFAGRVNELKKLKDYVEWIPENTVLESVSTFLKNTFNWNTKPPLMVTGIGGIGKSTLIAKFIINHLDYNGKGSLPFVYFDFDKPGLSLSNNMALLADALRQLKVQFPGQQEICDRIIDDIKRDYLGKDNYFHRSRGSDRERFFHEYMNAFGKSIDKPVLVVFDSFEEIQCRASATELHDFFMFVKQINEFIPRLRCVFVGRSEVKFEDLPFERIDLTSFDKEAAVSFLKSYGLNNKQVAEKVYDKFNGNPLTLLLAANILLHDHKDNETLSSVNVSRFFLRIDENLIQEQLVKRNLDHIHNEKVRNVAIPGILVRLINPEIIQNVLAKTCGLGELSPKECYDIFGELKKETFLIQQEGDDIYFRQDLRISLRYLIVKKDPEKATAIHTAAIAFYADRPDLVSRSEYIYHRLMRGDSTKDIEPFFDVSLRPLLERSLVEFSEEARLNIAPLLNIKLRTQTVEQADPGQWERYMITNIQSALSNGDEKTLLQIGKELKNRKTPKINILFSYYEAKLFIRLNDFKYARKSLSSVQETDISIKEVNNQVLVLGILLLECKMYEYEGNFKIALDKIQRILNSDTFINSTVIEKNADYLSILADIQITYARLYKRIWPHDMIEYPMPFRLWENKFTEITIAPIVYQRNILLTAKSKNGFRFEVVELCRHCWSEIEFMEGLQLLNKRCKNVVDLEKVLYKNWKVGLKDMTEPGDLKIVFQDALMFIEQTIPAKDLLSIF